MLNERESVLKSREFNIENNHLRAFYDENARLVFVVDLETNDRKPNVLLVINPDGDRKWDDILENDYGVNLEDVRPKKDNKYQKLDIEYSGLDLYADLFQAFDSGQSTDDELAQVNLFRDIAVRRAAAERLVVAETQAENARETIDRANDTIAEQSDYVRNLRTKLSQAKKNIGKEPTKQSAAKILRLESQIDAANEKQRRAKKRLDSAQKRLVVAADDAEVARNLLEKLGFDEEFDSDVPVAYHEQLPANIETGDVTVFQHPPMPAEINSYEITTAKTKAEDMADEEVKPLFDTDPEILDEEIAFKPVDFNDAGLNTDLEPVQPQSGQQDGVYADASAIEPLNFVPPVMPEPDVVQNTEQSVLNSITAVDAPAEDYTPLASADASPVYTPGPNVVPAPVSEPAPVDSGMRPVSPITGVAPVPEADNNDVRNKPTIVYYVMLVLLIVLSVFTLWFYQKSNTNNAMPSLGGAVQPEIIEEEQITEEAMAQNLEVDANAELNKEKVELVPEPVPEPELVTQPEPLPEPVAVVEEVPVVTEEPVSEPAPEPEIIEAPVVAVEPTDVAVPVVKVPIRTAPPAPEPEPIKIETEEEILAKKPAYGVSQDEAMFVADDDFETDRISVVDAEEELDVVEFTDTPVVAVSEPEYEYEYSDDYEYEYDEVPMCEGGAEPDRFGCCPGETYTQIDNGGYACCPDAGGDCFPPLN